ncbi:Hit family protein 1 [Astathelohania contejeani]|uniref:Hit family protein 1 n=1 Tax=Astathelohania contejeani TaxID=164912 RepID=A0ABQ7I0A6_9MICR|nr:Hit family protein 1 [Thelohania contejeani]
MSHNCIFCGIWKSQTNVIYKTDNLIVIPDIYPLSEGHMLVIPKEHGETLNDLKDESITGVLPLIKMITSKMGIDKYNILQNNKHIQSVPHVHFHIIPYSSSLNSLKIDWKVIEKEKDYIEKFVKIAKEKLDTISNK